MSAELEVPQAAIDTFAELSFFDPEHEYAVRAIATPVVVAELRAQEADLEHLATTVVEEDRRVGLRYAAAQLHIRAHELEEES